MNNKGDLMDLATFPIKIIMILFVVIITVALLPAFRENVDRAQGSDSLNCPGYIDWYTPESSTNYTYNSSLESHTMACTAIKLFPLLIVLIIIMIAILIALTRGSGMGYQDYGPYG